MIFSILGSETFQDEHGDNMSMVTNEHGFYAPCMIVLCLLISWEIFLEIITGMSTVVCTTIFYSHVVTLTRAPKHPRALGVLRCDRSASPFFYKTLIIVVHPSPPFLSYFPRSPSLSPDFLESSLFDAEFSLFAPHSLAILLDSGMLRCFFFNELFH